MHCKTVSASSQIDCGHTKDYSDCKEALRAQVGPCNRLFSETPTSAPLSPHPPVDMPVTSGIKGLSKPNCANIVL